MKAENLAFFNTGATFNITITAPRPAHARASRYSSIARPAPATAAQGGLRG
jgi:hypothetical protein